MTTLHLTLVRNATVLLAFGDDGPALLVDPMLDEREQVEPVENTRPPSRNPRVALPIPAEKLVEAADAVLVTHLHRDHLDATARALLPAGVRLLCQPCDAEALRADGFEDVVPVDERATTGPLEVQRVPARHTLGEHEQALGPVSGFVVRSPGAPSVYVAADCVWCDELAATLETFRPDVVVVNAGAARFVTGAPITMTAEDVIATARAAPRATVVAVHLEALNHCPMTRDELRRHLDAADLERVRVPEDGETLVLRPGSGTPDARG